MFSMSVQSNLVSFTESVLLLTKIYYWNIILQRRNTTPNACITVTDTKLFIWLIVQPPCTLTKQCLYLVHSAHYVLALLQSCSVSQGQWALSTGFCFISISVSAVCCAVMLLLYCILFVYRPTVCWALFSFNVYTNVNLLKTGFYFLSAIEPHRIIIRSNLFWGLRISLFSLIITNDLYPLFFIHSYDCEPYNLWSVVYKLFNIAW